MNIPAANLQLWEAYLASERVRVRQDYLESLERFIDALAPLSCGVWHSWALQLSAQFVDERQKIPIRLPLFRKVLFPALHAGLQQSIPGCARWLGISLDRARPRWPWLVTRHLPSPASILVDSNIADSI